MPIYKQSKGPRGRHLYFKKEDEDGKFKMVSINDIPEDILATMEPEKPISDQLPEFRKCIWCGAHGTDEKWINRCRYFLCLDDYQTRTTGELVQRIREESIQPA